MTSEPTGMCDVCGRSGSIHMTEIRDGVKTTRSFCFEHAPPEMREKMPFGPDRTAAEEVAFLRQHLATLDQLIADPGQRAKIRAEVEWMIAEIESGRRRMSDGSP